MEASAIQAGPGLGRPRIALGTPLLRLRSDQQLVALFREGNEEAFRVIHDRYRARLLAYVRQMLPGRAADVEDALQDVFVRTYAGLRTSNREVALRPWLYRVAHNRCIDELRRPQPVPELLEAHDHASECDPVAETERRESLRRLVADIGRLPEQQRSALLMREMSGMAYADVACALRISVPAVKSLLVRARIGLAQAIEARDAGCDDIRRELAEAHEEGVRPSWMARRHLRDCAGCRACRAEIRTQGRRVAALAPTVGPLAVFAKLFGVGTGAGGGTATVAGAGGAGAGAASGLATVTVGHVAAILAAAVVTAGGAVAVQTVAAQPSHHATHAVRAAPAGPTKAPAEGTMRVPALIPAAASAAHPHAVPVRRGPQAAPHSAARRGPAYPTATPIDMALPGQSTEANSTTCTPPPPPTACTASQTTTCSPGSESTTSPGTQTTTTGHTTTTPGQGTSTTPGQSTTTTPGQGTTTTPGQGTTTTPGQGTSTTTGQGTSTTTGQGTTSSTNTAATCSSTSQPISSQGTGSTGTESTGTGQTGTPPASQTQPVKQT